MSAIKLWDHQEEFVNNIREGLRRNKRIIARADTGFGKTVCAAEIARRCKGTVITAVHRKELKRQTLKTYNKFGLCENMNGSPKAIVNTIQTLVKQDVNTPVLIMLDECHLSMAKTWQKFLDRFPNAYVIGWTATPQRLDGQPLGSIYDEIIDSKSVKWLMDNKFLSKYDYYAPYLPDLSKVKKKMGDYSIEDLNIAMGGKIIDDAIGKYKDICNGKRVIAFCPSIMNSKLMQKKAEEQGVNCYHIDGTMNDKDRQKAISDFANNGGILTNVSICTEGFDLSAQIDRDITVEGVMLLRPTHSLALYRQMVGRALRKKDYSAVILDFAGNFQRHGFPDTEVKWSLEGKVKRNSDDISIQRCPDCFHVQKPSVSCEMCGHLFEADGRVIEELSGELVLIDSEEYVEAEKREYAAAKTLEDFVKIEKRKSYKVGWAEQSYKLKNGVWLKSTDDGLRYIAKVRGYSSGWIWQQKKYRR